METISAPAPRRIIRRLVPWTLASGLFVGGGATVYHLAIPSASGPVATSEVAVDPFASPSSSTASATSQQINQLFAQTPPAATAAVVENRYAAAPEPAPAPLVQASQLDEVATPRSAAELEVAQNPFAGAPAMTPAAEAAAPELATPVAEATVAADAAPTPADIDPVAAMNQTEVTRGQEPGVNPLRAAARPAAAAPEPTAAAPAAAVATQAAPVSSNPFAAPSRYGAPAPAPEASAAAANAANAFAEAEPTPATPSMADPAAAPLPVAAQAVGAPPAGVEPMQVASQHSYSQAPQSAPLVAEPPASPFANAAPMAVASRSEPPTFANEINPAAGASAALTDASITPTPGLATADGSGRPGSRDLEGLQSPTITIQKLAPAEIQVNRKCTFAVRVHNNSQRIAHNVEVHDEIPLGTQLVGTAPKAQVAGAQVVWTLGTMAPGEERIVEMELLPTEEGELGSIATVTFAAQASAKVRCTKPELALRLTAPPRVMIGEKHLVEIEVNNPGSGDATGVMLLESIPEGVTHEAGPALEYEIGTLKAGESKRLDLLLTAKQAGRINNVMTARADANLEVQANCEFEVVAPALKVSIEGPGMRYLDRPATYTVNIENPGTAPAKELQLITQLPKGLQFKSANNMGEYDPATHSVHWSLAELPANERGSVQLTALPIEAGPQRLQVAGRAEQGLEDRTETNVMVEGLVALSFEVSASDGAIEVEGETGYDITVVNQGSKAAANMQVQVVLPAGLRATNGSGATRHVIEGDRVVFAPVPQLAPKGEAKFRVQVQGLRAGDQRAKIMVTADEVTEPITKEQSTRVYADQ